MEMTEKDRQLVRAAWQMPSHEWLAVADLMEQAESEEGRRELCHVSKVKFCIYEGEYL